MTRKITTALLAALVALTMSVPAALAQDDNTGTINQGQSNDQFSDQCCNNPSDGSVQNNNTQQSQQTQQANQNVAGSGGDQTNVNVGEQKAKSKNSKDRKKGGNNGGNDD